MRRGDDIVKFMNDGARHPHVIVVHSHKYWRSPNCMYELVQLEEELKKNKGKSFLSVVIPVELPSSRVGNRDGIDEYAAFWRAFAGEVPARLPWTREELKDFASATLRLFGREISSSLDVNIRWKDGEVVALGKIAERLDPIRADNA